tara:strand:+ start:821 stop:1159 length:339 start_codon:yes stop_codon:yes gene_type:complete
MVAGKIHFEFDYYNSKIINKTKNIVFKDVTVNINKYQYLILDLYDACKCVESKNLVKRRKLIVYYNNGEIEEFTYNSLDKTIGFDGEDINKIVIKKPNELHLKLNKLIESVK